MTLPTERIPRALSPRGLRAGPAIGKPLADFALAARFARAHAREPFDCALAHNAEAAVAGLVARAGLGVPVVYVAHTLLAEELSSYRRGSRPGEDRIRRGIDAFGRAVDRGVARHCDGVIALSVAARDALAPVARGPVTVIPPGLLPERRPDAREVAEACGLYGLDPGRFACYAGNLDGYQDLGVLDAAARRTGAPVVAVTHSRAKTGGPFARREGPGLRVLSVGTREARWLLYGSGVAVLPRRLRGGFPIKALNYMEAGRAIVARRGVVDGLEHRRSAWLLPPDAGPDAWANAIDRLLAEPDLADALGEAARDVLHQRHAWPQLAARTASLLDDVAAARVPSRRRAGRRASGSPLS